MISRYVGKRPSFPVIVSLMLVSCATASENFDEALVENLLRQVNESLINESTYEGNCLLDTERSLPEAITLAKGNRLHTLEVIGHTAVSVAAPGNHLIQLRSTDGEILGLFVSEKDGDCSTFSVSVVVQ